MYVTSATGLSVLHATPLSLFQGTVLSRLFLSDMTKFEDVTDTIQPPIKDEAVDNWLLSARECAHNCVAYHAAEDGARDTQLIRALRADELHELRLEDL